MDAAVTSGDRPRLRLAAFAVPDTSIVIYDLVTGRLRTGHQEDYLVALEEALGAYSPETFAPFRQIKTLRPDDRFQRCLLGYRAFRRAFSAGAPALVIVPNPGPLDFVLVYLAALTGWRRRRGGVAMFMRRDAAGIVGAGRRAKILEWTVRRLARSRHFYMISDTRVAADYWQARTGRPVRLVSIPVRRLPTSVSARTDDAVRIGLLGAFRLEKGAAHYSDVISVALTLAADIRVECQYPDEPATQPERELAKALEGWVNEPRVTFHRGHLDSTAYTALLYGTDVVVLPYDVRLYGPGTSGVLFEALAAGRLVIATRIAWAIQEYRDHPNVIWLDSIDRTSLANAIGSAIVRIKGRRPQGAQEETAPDQFKATWATAIEEIGRDMQSEDQKRVCQVSDPQAPSD